MQAYHTYYFQFHCARDVVWQEIIRYLFLYIPKPQSVLDIGAGYGSFINNCPARRKVAVDAWSGFAKYIKDAKCIAYDVRRGLTKVIHEKFDLIMMSNFLEHLEMEEAAKVLNDLHSLLSKNGHVIFIQPNFTYSYKHYFDDYTHKTIYTHVSLSYFLKEHDFETVRVEERFLPYSFRSNLPKWRFLARIYLHLPWRPMAGQMLLIAKSITGIKTSFTQGPAFAGL